MVILVAFIQKEKEKSYQEGASQKGEWAKQMWEKSHQETLSQIRLIIEGMKAIGYDRAYIHRESLVKKLCMLK